MTSSRRLAHSYSRQQLNIIRQSRYDFPVAPVFLNKTNHFDSCAGDAQGGVVGNTLQGVVPDKNQYLATFISDKYSGPAAVAVGASDLPHNGNTLPHEFAQVANRLYWRDCSHGCYPNIPTKIRDDLPFSLKLTNNPSCPHGCPNIEGGGSPAVIIDVAPHQKGDLTGVVSDGESVASGEAGGGGDLPDNGDFAAQMVGQVGDGADGDGGG